MESLASLELSYPTYVAIVGLAARRALHYLGLMNLSPEFREMGPHYAAESVSYTHLDVYKRQTLTSTSSPALAPMICSSKLSIS